MYFTMKYSWSVWTPRATTPSNATVVWIHLDISTTTLSTQLIHWGTCCNVLSFLFASLATPAPAQSFYMSILTRNSLYSCPDVNCSANGLFYYQPIGFMTATSGDYVIQSNSTMETAGYIFNSTFSQIKDVSGVLMSDDDSSGYHQFLMTTSVRTMFNYTLIVTTYAANMTGPFSVSATGDPPLTFFALWGCSGKTEIDESLLTIVTSYWLTWCLLSLLRLQQCPWPTRAIAFTFLAD